MKRNAGENSLWTPAAIKKIKKSQDGDGKSNCYPINITQQMNQSSSRNNPHPPPPQGGDRHGGGGEFYQGTGGGGGRRRPYPTTFATDERNNIRSNFHEPNNLHFHEHSNNFNNRDQRGPEYAPDDGGMMAGNNWGGQSNFRGGRGGGGGGRGGGRGARPFQPPPDQREQQYQQHQRKNDSQNPLPPDQRRTLVLANVPPHMKHFHIKSHFQQNWGISVNYAHVDKQSGLAYVRFEEVDDAKRVWAVGTNGLDGPNYHAGGSEQGSSSILSEGVVLQEVYFTNFVPIDKTYDDTQSTMSRKHSRGADEYVGRERGGGGAGVFNHHPDERDAKMARRDQYPKQDTNNNMKPAPSHINPSNNSYNRTEQKHQLTPEALELKKKKQEEYQKQYEAFQKEEQEWRKRRNAEYQTFATAKNERTAQISTLQQKKDLQSKQETMLAKQLPLHKKMLSMLKSKNSPASEQSKKMKEILSTQTQLLELKKDMKNTVEELEKLKEEERVKGVFVPSEKRPVFVANGSSAGVKKRSLDRRSTVLRVEGFGEEQFDEEILKVELKEHFSAFGAVSDVSLERDNAHDDDIDDDVPVSVFALVHFSKRLDAEKAKESGANFNEVSLKCSWHHEQSSSTPNDGNDAEDDAVDSIGVGAEESNFHNDLYDDAEIEESYGDYFSGEGLPTGEEHDMVDYDYGGDDDMVDYD
jgi:hypothetical protein